MKTRPRFGVGRLHIEHHARRGALRLALALLAGAGCATGTGGPGKADGKPASTKIEPLTPAEKQKMEALGDPEMVSDVEQMMAKMPRATPVFSCVGAYIAGLDAEKDHAINARGILHSCIDDCAKQSSGPHADVALKYGALCKQRYEGVGANAVLTNVREKMQFLRESKFPDEWRTNGNDAQEAIQNGKKKLGADNKDLAPLEEEYNTLISAHRRDLEKAQGFYKRQDIAQMRDEIGRLNLELRNLETRAGSHPGDGTKALILVKEQKRTDLTDSIDREAKKAGIRR